MTTTTKKWTATDLGPRQLKAFSNTLRATMFEAKTSIEWNGIIEADGSTSAESRMAYIAAVTPSGNSPEQIAIVEAIGERHGWTATKANYRAIIAELEASQPALRDAAPVIDKRRTRADVDAVKAKRDAAEAARQAEKDAQREAIGDDGVEWLDLKDAAKDARIALKRDFPGVKFSVRIERFSMGNAMRVSWTDGPTTDQVSELLSVFEYGRFDAMTDYAYSRDDAVRTMPGSGRKFLNGGAKYVTTRRDFSDAARASVSRQDIEEAQRSEHRWPLTEAEACTHILHKRDLSPKPATTDAAPATDDTGDADAPAFELREGTNKRGKFWLVVPSAHLGDAFKSYLAAARELGGWYSRAWRATKQPGGFGFAHDDRASAERFMARGAC